MRLGLDASDLDVRSRCSRGGGICARNTFCEIASGSSFDTVGVLLSCVVGRNVRSSPRLL